MKSFTRGKHVLFGAVLALLCANPALALTQVANYATGQPGAESYEHFSFWIKDNQVREIEYAYGKEGRSNPLRLSYLGKTVVQGQTGFKVKFPNALILTVIPQGSKLKVVDGKGKYAKSFSWEYVGPIDGRGMVCTVCASDETAAMNLLKSYYLK